MVTHATVIHTMLIVDDSNIIRRKIERTSDNSQFSIVGCASNGLEALDLVKQFKPDVITMDLTMPKMDGIECIENIMKITPKVKILVVSALSDKATGIEALEKGARGFLCKPFEDNDLANALKELVKG